ncbi:MAG: spore maturation protein A [Clostridia bacterium]|nr:spore maturation protein A [Clostridia bacterium]
MNYIWPLMIIFSFICAIFSGNMDAMSNAVIESGTNAVALAIKLLGIICLWNGLIKVAEKSGLTASLAKLLSPVLKLLFPELKDQEAKQAISMNITANILGLDNAATPLGLKAMKRLNEISDDKQKADDNMVRFVVINTASIHILSTTVAILRSEHLSKAPAEIIIPSLLTSGISLCCGLLMTTVLKKVFK